MFIEEAITYGLREGVKLGAIYLLWRALFFDRRWPVARASLLAGFGAAFLIFGLLTLAGPGMAEREFVYRFSGYVLFLIFFAASVVLLRFPMAGVGRANRPWPIWAGALVSLALLVFLAPDAIAMGIFLHDLSVLKGSAAAVYASFWGTAIVAFYVLSSIARKWAGRAGAFFVSAEGGGLANALMFMVLVKLLLSGLAGLDEVSLLPTVQRGVMKFVHDLVHQSFLFLQVPDHPMLKITVWNFIGYLFGPGASVTLALGLLLAPSIVYLYTTLTAEVQYPDELETPAQRRLLRAGTRSQRLSRIVPVAAFVFLVTASWFVSGSEKGVALYLPEATPVIAEKGMVIIPLSSPGVDLMDGQIHKFSVVVDGQGVNFFIIKKGDGTLAVTLDACEICLPDGYGQRDSHVVCVYCMTPIPVDTLGEPGGCNPIPLEAEITSRDVRVRMDDISSKWRKLVNKMAGGQGGADE